MNLPVNLKLITKGNEAKISWLNIKSLLSNCMNFDIELDDLKFCANCDNRIYHFHNILNNKKYFCCNNKLAVFAITRYYNKQLNPDDKLRKIIIDNKYASNIYSRKIITKIFQYYLNNIAKELVLNSDVILSVPNTTNKNDREDFHQLEFITKEISKNCKIPFLLEVIKKDYITGYSYGIDSNKIEDKRILIIDDVYRTGNTIRTCMHMVNELGAISVKGIVLAKTIWDDLFNPDLDIFTEDYHIKIK